MKKKLGIVIVAGLLTISLVVAALASELQQVEYNSGFHVQNLSPTDDANVILTYYPQTGSPVQVQDKIFAGSSVTYFPIHNLAGDPFSGSVVVSSDTPVAAIVNTLGDFPQYAAATTAFSAGSTSFSLPLVMCENNGFDTWFNIQNVGLDTANIAINYIAGFAGADDGETTTIEARRAKTFSQASGSSTINCDTLAGTDGRFVGSATITSDQPVVATVMQINIADNRILLGYNGFAGGAADVRAPLIMSNNNGFYTGLQVQNAGTTTTTVTVGYADNTVGSLGLPKPEADIFELGPGASRTLIHNSTPPQNGSVVNDYDAIGRYIGAAIVTSNNDAPLVAIVNQAYLRQDAGPFGTAYEGFNADDASDRLSAPLIMANNNTYYTGIQVQNTGTSAVSVTISYGPNTVGIAGPVEPQDESFSLQPGASKTIIQNAAPPANGSTVNNWDEIGTYVGSLAVTANGPVAAIVNEFTWGFPGDQFYSYDAVNY
jgi:hypothetical protein